MAISVVKLTKRNDSLIRLLRRLNKPGYIGKHVFYKQFSYKSNCKHPKILDALRFTSDKGPLWGFSSHQLQEHNATIQFSLDQQSKY